MKGNSIDIITVPKLSSYFYDELQSMNKKTKFPVPEEIIYYSSELLEMYTLNVGFDSKVLGTDLMRAKSASISEQKRIYKEVGDTALILTGYFSESISRKLVGRAYYTKLGKIAYVNMDTINSNFFDIPNFYKLLASYFDGLSTLIKLFANNKETEFNKLLLESASNEELNLLGITPNTSKIIS
jgi:transcriptional regulator NrdR family protein